MSPTQPSSDLEEALRSMRWRVEAGAFALVGFPEPPVAEDFAALMVPPGQLIREVGETTLLVREEQVADLLTRHPDAAVERGLFWVRFETAMGWEVVGFLSLVTSRLAAADVPIGAVCSYSRDHLFVAEAYRATTERVLEALFPRAEPRDD